MAMSMAGTSLLVVGACWVGTMVSSLPLRSGGQGDAIVGVWAPSSKGRMAGPGAKVLNVTQELSLVSEPDTGERRAGQLERKLKAGSVGLLRSVRYAARRFWRVVWIAVSQWTEWSLEALLLAPLGLALALGDKRMVLVWRKSGWSGLLRSILVSIVIFVRLCVDRRVPAVGKMLVFLALVYSVAGSDALPDRLWAIGLLDDLLVLGICASCFIRICPEAAVQEFASRWYRP